MDARGYGRHGEASRGQRRRTGALMLCGLLGVCVGSYALLDVTAPRWLAAPMLAAGLLAAGLGLASAGARVGRSRYRPDRWRWPEGAVVAGGLVVGWAGWWLGEHQGPIAHPGLDVVPQVSLAVLLALGVGLAAALCAPPQGRA
jgi:energy-coupling factor transport system permease protein